LIRRRAAWIVKSVLTVISGAARKSVMRRRKPEKKKQNRQAKTGQDGDESFVEVFPATNCRCGDSIFCRLFCIFDQQDGIDNPMDCLAVGKKEDPLTEDRTGSGQRT